MLATNSFNLLYGWRRHEELYAAFRNLSGDHTELGKDVQSFYKEQSERSIVAFNILAIPLGVYPDSVPYAGIWLKSFKRFRQSTQYKELMRKTGILGFWRKEGFPPMCRPIGDDDFECD